ncbi:MAG: hypothetical protein D6776_11995 [Planctomycetota bacterium]|nr:MAG: hypothetical protein D6776_11995 [Planctomycetota bacterium]
MAQGVYGGGRRRETLAEVVESIDLRPPSDEFRRLVQARIEALARLGESAPGDPESLDLYADALRLGLEAIAEASR